MPTDTPQFQRGQGADQLAYGQAQAANALMGLMGPENPPEEHAPQGPEEEFLFAPTDRPKEPITAGAPFGPGPNVIRGSFQSDDDVVTQVADQLQTQPVGAETRAWLNRAKQEG